MLERVSRELAQRLALALGACCGVIVKVACDAEVDTRGLAGAARERPAVVLLDRRARELLTRPTVMANSSRLKTLR